MRDDFQIPNLGQAPKDKYEQSFFNRVVRNIETTFQSLRAKGQGIFSDLHADTLDVSGTVTLAGDIAVTGNATVTGDLTVDDITTDDITADSLTLTTPLAIASGGTNATTVAGATTSLQAVSYGSAQSLSTTQARQGRRNILSAQRTKYSVKSANYTAVLDDDATTFLFTASATLTLTSAATLGPDWSCNVKAYGAVATVTVAPSGSETINGSTSANPYYVPRGSNATILCDGTSFYFVDGPSSWETIMNTNVTNVVNLNAYDLDRYSLIRISGHLYVSGAASVHILASATNGSAWYTAAGSYGEAIVYGTSGGTTVSSTGYTVNTAGWGFRIGGYGGNLQTTQPGVRFNLFMQGMKESYTTVEGNLFYINATPTQLFGQYHGLIGANINALSFITAPASGNLMSGRIFMEGVR